jgi:membrane-associated protein
MIRVAGWTVSHVTQLAATTVFSLPMAPSNATLFIRQNAWLGLAVVAGAGATLLVALGAIELPDPGAILSDASESLGAWTYGAVPALAFLETGAFVGLVVPGETAVLVGGVAAERGEVALLPLIGMVWAAAVAGDVVSFLLGRRLGRRFLVVHGPRLRVDADRLARVEGFYDRHGGKAILVGRFVGVVRAVSPFLAGASGLQLRRFVPYSIAGALVWAAAFTLVGYGFSESFEAAGATATRVALAGAVAVAVVLAVAAHLRGRRRAPGCHDCPAAAAA